MLRNYLFIFLLFYSQIGVAQSDSISSPDKAIKVVVSKGDKLTYTVLKNNLVLVSQSAIAMDLENLTTGKKFLTTNSKVKKRMRQSVNEVIISPIPEKRKNIPDIYNQLTLQLENNVSLIFRAYNDGVAYRWETTINDSIIVRQEIAEISIPGNPRLLFTESVKRDNQDRFHTSFEEPYSNKPLDSVGSLNLIFSPLLVSRADGLRLLITESDLFDYPGMFLSGDSKTTLRGVFAPYALEDTITGGEFKQWSVSKRASYIARTTGKRKFPWRVIAIANTDKELPGNDIVYRLASPSSIIDPSWIQPGKGTDEWIIGINLFNVPFKSGVNTATYKFYIDFAKKFGFNRIMMDAGWSDYDDLFKINKEIDMETIAAYAREKNVKLSMWTLAMTLDRQLEPALQQFKKWGVDFIMTDFMDRDDQKMLNFYTRVAEACARQKIMVMYHGAFKPAGFGRTWPNAITREAVLGSEYNIWSEKPTPEHNLHLPFIRMVAGPMDYEPGILDNATRETFRPIGSKVMSSGTRCHQLAMFVIYESPIQIFSGNPSQGLLEPVFMELLGSIPTVWDTTIVLEGQVGDYIITARKKGTDWFIGGMTDWTARQFSLDLSFLDEGKYKATICEDGINADRYGSDYLLTTNMEFDSKKKLVIKMAPGGGYLVRLSKAD
ncbi:MAG: glycoside hydrolase family 97 protein [Chitinophagaceae bacterium]|nr:glycoside hydrolase family 97 protein [Chitinophagaceae bacterium]